MRFHHSTRRGRTKLSGQRQASAHRSSHNPTSTSRWSQLGYCRETNIHFNQRHPIQPPPEIIEFDRRMSLTQADQYQQLLDAGRRATSEARNHADQQIDDKIHQLTLEDAASCREPSPVLPADERQHHHHRRASARRKQQVELKEQQQVDDESKTIDMERAREKLIAQVKKHPFWSNKAAKRMRLTRVDERQVYIYELTSYCERRDLEWRYEPYRGGLVRATPFRRPMGSADPAGELAASTIVAPPQASMMYSTNCTTNPPSSPLSACSAGAHHQSLGWSSSAGSGTCGASSLARSPVRRCHSSVPSAAAATASAVERPMPSAEAVWSVELGPQVRPAPFAAQVHACEMPDTSFVKRCHGCQGRGRIKCQSCYGVGYEVCISCSGKGTTRNLSRAAGGAGGHRASYSNQDYYGYSRNSTQASPDDCSSALASASSETRSRRHEEPGGISGGSNGSGGGGAWLTESCHFCHGAGQKRCWICAGKSYNPCAGCHGCGQLRCYLHLSVTWSNHRDETILNNADSIIPRDRLRLCTGRLLIDEAATRLAPLCRERLMLDGAASALAAAAQVQDDQPNQLRAASGRLLDKHAQSYRNERLLRQRHKVTRIDCHIVSYEWKKRRGHFVIYGDERKVYIAKYPFKSLCNIT